MARILLAEDDAAMLDVVRRALEADGHSITAAQDGQEALDLLCAPGATFDILLTDIQMPSVDGIAVATSGVAGHPGLRVILMSAFADGVTIPDGLKPHIAKTLTKPLAIDQVRTAVRAAGVK
jgi:DNA-binding NtrC family response regulator